MSYDFLSDMAQDMFTDFDNYEYQAALLEWHQEHIGQAQLIFVANDSHALLSTDAKLNLYLSLGKAGIGNAFIRTRPPRACKNDYAQALKGLYGRSHRRLAGDCGISRYLCAIKSLWTCRKLTLP